MDTPQGPNGRKPPFPFDAIYKALFRDRDTVADLLRNHLAAPDGPLGAELLRALDMRTLRRLPAEWITKDFHARRGDQVWCVDFRERARGRWPARLFIHLEFQSREDGDMALRFVDYGGELHRELRGSDLAGPDEACPILCVVIHNGTSPWRAPTHAGDHMRLPPAFGDASPPPGLAAFHPWGYHPLDLARLRGREPVPGSVVSLIAAIEYAGPKGLPDMLRGLLLDTARGLNPRLRETVGDWLRLLAERYGIELPELEEMMGYEFEELPPVTSRLVESMDAAFADAHSTGFDEGRSEGIERERSHLCRMAGLKFGSASVEAMPGLMAGVFAPGDLREVGECLIQSDTADQFLACIRDILSRSAK